MRTAWGCPSRLRMCPYPEDGGTHAAKVKCWSFWLAHLAGLEYLKDISHSAHPLDQDQAVARAWGQSSWADSSGVQSDAEVPDRR